MTDLSADLALADSEARASRERVMFEAWAKTQSWPHYWHDGVGMAFNARSFEAWKARAALAPAVPPGWKLVPVEPTNAMWDAAVLEENRISRDFPGQHPSCFQIWKSMVSAAPSAKEPTCPKN